MTLNTPRTLQFPGNIVNMFEHFPVRLEESIFLVLQSMFGKEPFDARANFRVIDLRHGGEQMMLDLEVQVPHEPIHQEIGADIHGMVRRGGDEIICSIIRFCHYVRYHKYSEKNR